MKIFVKVKPNAKENRVKQVGDNQFAVWVKARPQKGEANQELIRVLAEYFDIAKSCITLAKGQTSKHKTRIIKHAS